MPFDDELVAFQDLELQWSGLLVGNGASRVISDKFAYTSLYEKACSDAIQHPLIADEQNVFTAFGTHNFEQVLSALSVSIVVNHAFNQPTTAIEESYEKIRLSLVEAVHAVHIPHAEVPQETLLAMRAALLEYDFVYTTNYDLLLYWTIMQGKDEFRDYFFSGSTFDIGNTEVWHKSTKILFLHGALHLYRTRLGQTYKRAGGLTGNLLDDFATPIPQEDGAVPLFITEGSSAEKLRSIYTSDYLSFAYSQLSRHAGPLVIFGQSMEDEFDKHLTIAIKSSACKDLGIGIYRQNVASIADMKAKWAAKFPKLDLHFFDSETHPLGDPAFRV